MTAMGAYSRFESLAVVKYTLVFLYVCVHMIDGYLRPGLAASGNTYLRLAVLVNGSYWFPKAIIHITETSNSLHIEAAHFRRARVRLK